MNRLKLFLSTVKSSKIYKNYVDRLELKGDEAIFELGSHIGYLSRHIAKRLCDGGYLTCSDISDESADMLKTMLRKYNNVNFCFGEIRKMNIDCEIYDKVILNDCLVNLSKPERESYLRFLLSLIKPNANIYVRQPISSQGISSSEVRQLMRELKLKEVNYRFDKYSKQTVYSATFKLKKRK